MGDLADVYEEGRTGLSTLVGGLSDEERAKPVPATPGWRVRDVIAHLAGDAACVIAGDYPREFFEAFGQDAAVATLNRWTSGHVARGEESSMSDILEEWERSAAILTQMMRGQMPWPDGVPFIADRVLITDLGAHQQDIYGALAMVRDREGPPVRIGVAGFVAVLDMRLRSDNRTALRIEAGEKQWVVGGDDPHATLRSDRFELFRALSGRRSPDQIRAYEWAGDPEPYVSYFYPYGVRNSALVE